MMPGIPAVCSLWIENGEAFIKRNARMMWRKTPNSREELPEYVERSCHEAQINYTEDKRPTSRSDRYRFNRIYPPSKEPPQRFLCH